MSYEYDDDDEAVEYLGTMEQREKEEMEFYTDLAVQEMQRWIEVGPCFVMVCCHVCRWGLALNKKVLMSLHAMHLCLHTLAVSIIM